MSNRELIIKIFSEVLDTTDSSLSSTLEDNTVLLDSGLDSLGFAILVARLEEELGFDPFVEMKEAIYPTTFAEFVKIYDERKGAL